MDWLVWALIATGCAVIIGVGSLLWVIYLIRLVSNEEALTDRIRQERRRREEERRKEQDRASQKDDDEAAMINAARAMLAEGSLPGLGGDDD